MFKIGDFSQLAQVTIRTLRHYDALGLLKPAHTDPDSDYRYYTLEQLSRLNRILALKDLGLSLDQIKVLLQENLPLSRLQSLLQAKQAELAAEVAARQAQLQRVLARLHIIEREDEPLMLDVVIKAVPALTLLGIWQTVPTLDDMPDLRYHTAKHLYHWLETHDITPEAPETVFYDLLEYRDTDIAMFFGVPVPTTMPPIAPDERVKHIELRAEPLVASVIHKGFLPDIAYTIAALMKWVGVNGYESIAPPREFHLFGREFANFDDCYDEHDGIPHVTMEVQLPIQPQQPHSPKRHTAT